MMKPSFAIVGCGKVGTALGRFMAGAGYRPAGFASRSEASAERTAGLIGSGSIGRVPWEITKLADIVLLTTPDGVIEETCARIVENGGFREKAIVLHCSGAHPSTILNSARQCGAEIGSMHPLQSIASGETAENPFSGIIISVEGDAGAVKAGKEIAEDLGATQMEIRTGGKALYHASAVVASNYLVTLLDLAFKMIENAGVPREDAYGVLKPLVMGTLANVEKTGIPNALTGPIARGDTETVKRHLSELGKNTPELLPLYKALGLHTVDIAAAGGAIERDTAEEFINTLKD